MFNLASYLARIGYSGSLAPTADTLRGLHLAHLYTVPFENLDIHTGRPIVLDEDRFFGKVVNERRGGYCFELNGLFARLLRELGFTVTLLSAGVWESERGRFGPDCDHLTLLVQPPEGERWLADVGFGESFTEPLRFDYGGDQIQNGKVYRILRDEDNYQMFEEGPDGYVFALRPRRLYDFTYANHFMQTSPDSSFTRNIICSRATPEGRITVSDMRLIITRNGERTERALADPAERLAVLRDSFGFELPSDTVFKSPLKP